MMVGFEKQAITLDGLSKDDMLELKSCIDCMLFEEELKEWWDSDACKELQKSNEEAKQRAVGKYFMLSEEDKLDMVQAICLLCVRQKRRNQSQRIDG
jgi:hypothetical protein